MKIDTKKGFTLAELLIVVAIISVLTAIGIPIFTTQLEKSREATDLANVRGAYAQLMENIMEEDLPSASITVPLVQKVNGWTTKLPLNIAGIVYNGSETENWRGQPAENGTCIISYDTKTDQLVLNWNGNNIISNLDFMNGAWAGRFTANSKSQHVDNPKCIISTYNKGDSKYPGLYELEPNTKYKVSFTYNPSFDDPNDPTKGIFAKAMVLWDSNGKNVVDTGTGPYVLNSQRSQGIVNYTYTANKDNTITYSATFTTPSEDSSYYYGMNFGAMNVTNASTGKIEGALDFNRDLNMSQSQVEALKNEIKNSFTVEKVN